MKNEDSWRFLLAGGSNMCGAAGLCHVIYLQQISL